MGRERGDFCAERFRVDCVRLEAGRLMTDQGTLGIWAFGCVVNEFLEFLGYSLSNTHPADNGPQPNKPRRCLEHLGDLKKLRKHVADPKKG